MATVSMSHEEATGETMRINVEIHRGLWYQFRSKALQNSQTATRRLEQLITADLAAE